MTTIVAHADPLAICRFAPGAPVPAWATQRAFFSVTRTDAELSIICSAAHVPSDVHADRDWRALELRGPFELAAVGILLAVAAPLAAARVPILPVATFDTDYVLVKHDQLVTAIQALRAAGHTVDTTNALLDLA